MFKVITTMSDLLFLILFCKTYQNCT